VPFLRGWCAPGAQFKWSIQATTNLTARLSLEDLKLLHKSGLHQICQGAESGSRKVWKAMNKDFQDFPTIYESAARCLAAGIRPSFNIIFAFPGEGAKERRETISFVMDVCRKFPGAEFWTNIFTPYPGAPIMDKVAELGIRRRTRWKAGSTFSPLYQASLVERPRS
jgi:anaerobic magnesium-protoporphyrin IX monomethyl ester cyclase